MDFALWWDQLVPPQQPHYGLLQETIQRVDGMVQVLWGVFRGVLKGIPCWWRVEQLVIAESACRELQSWMAALVGGRSMSGDGDLAGLPNTSVLSIDGAPAVGPLGVLEAWVEDAVSHLLPRLAALLLLLPMPLCSPGVEYSLYATVDGLMQTQRTWPWILDATVAASAAHVPAAHVPLMLPAFSSNLTFDGFILRSLIQDLIITSSASPLVVEVGVDRGGTSDYLLENFPGLRLVGIDPYPEVYMGVPSSALPDTMGSEEAYKEATAKYSRFKARAELLRLPSLKAAQTWSRGEVDLVFIDGEHDFKSCRDDIEAWAPLVRPGGIVAGDDYLTGSGVPEAVHALLPYGTRLNIAPNAVWWWVK